MSRQLHPLLAEVLERGYIELEGRRYELHSNIPVEECELLYRQVEAVGATEALEIGMAYGVASLALADALNSASKTPKLISIDPNQHGDWDGVAIRQLERAGFSQFCELIEESSHFALPRLVESGCRVDLALIDGWHTFDHCLVDFFFVDLLLRPGGVVVLDDTWMPGVRAVAEFALRNRAYDLVDSVPLRLSRRASLLRTVRARSRLLPPVAAVALRKQRDDDRPWHHFQSFDA
ncbi:MAG TPA: class I SAM-dependent methyltransferase [Gaiellaceae bacterium]|nr:class I SAM-dependent methyltransferase [Gaiellaceae bacterium]